PGERLERGDPAGDGPPGCRRPRGGHRPRCRHAASAARRRPAADARSRTRRGCLMKGIAKSMLTTLSTFARKPVTRDYPNVHKPLPKTDRAFPLLLWDHEVVEPFCTGCHACERACPVECMTVLMKDNPNHKSLGGNS